MGKFTLSNVHLSPNEVWHYACLYMYHVPNYMPRICPHLDTSIHQACTYMIIYQNMLENIHKPIHARNTPIFTSITATTIANT